MPGDAVATTFITGFIGTELIKPALANYVARDAVLSNIRRRGTGVHFDYPTLEHGLQQVLGALHE